MTKKKEIRKGKFMTQETGINDYRTTPWAQIETRHMQRKSKQ